MPAVPFVDATPDGLAVAIEGLRIQLRAHLPEDEVPQVDLVLKTAQAAARDALTPAEASDLRRQVLFGERDMSPEDRHSLVQKLARIAARRGGGGA